MTMGFCLIVAIEAVGVIVIVATAISVVLEDERNAKKQKEGQQENGSRRGGQQMKVVRWANMTAYFLLGIVVGVVLVVPMCVWKMLCEPFHAVKTIIGIGLLTGAKHGA